MSSTRPTARTGTQTVLIVPSFGYYRDAPLSRCYGRRLPTTR